MPLIGIVAKKRDIQCIRREIRDKNNDIIEITKESIKNIRNIKFEEIIFIENINLTDEEYKYMNEIISNSQYLIVNGEYLGEKKIINVKEEELDFIKDKNKLSEYHALENFIDILN